MKKVLHILATFVLVFSLLTVQFPSLILAQTEEDLEENECILLEEEVNSEQVNNQSPIDTCEPNTLDNEVVVEGIIIENDSSIELTDLNFVVEEIKTTDETVEVELENSAEEISTNESTNETTIPVVTNESTNELKTPVVDENIEAKVNEPVMSTPIKEAVPAKEPVKVRKTKAVATKREEIKVIEPTTDLTPSNVVEDKSYTFSNPYTGHFSAEQENKEFSTK